MHDHCGSHFEDQKLAILRLAAIDRQVFEPAAVRDGPEGRRMPSAEVAVEIRHEAGFLGTLGRIVPHIGVKVMDHPVLRDRHMAHERAALDDGDAGFAE